MLSGLEISSKVKHLPIMSKALGSVSRTTKAEEKNKITLTKHSTLWL